MVKLEDLYFEHDPRPHEGQCEVSGVTWPEGCSLRDGRAMPLNQPCKEECLWSPLCCAFLRAAAIAGHTDPVLMAGLGHDLAYGHIARAVADRAVITVHSGTAPRSREGSRHSWCVHFRPVISVQIVCICGICGSRAPSQCSWVFWRAR
jgi:hypothetical protein